MSIFPEPRFPASPTMPSGARHDLRPQLWAYLAVVVTVCTAGFGTYVFLSSQKVGMGARTTGMWTREFCLHGVQYVQAREGLAVELDPEGRVLPCMDEPSPLTR